MMEMYASQRTSVLCVDRLFTPSLAQNAAIAVTWGVFVRQPNCATLPKNDRRLWVCLPVIRISYSIILTLWLLFMIKY